MARNSLNRKQFHGLTKWMELQPDPLPTQRETARRAEKDLGFAVSTSSIKDAGDLLERTFKRQGGARLNASDRVVRLSRIVQAIVEELAKVELTLSEEVQAGLTALANRKGPPEA